VEPMSESQQHVHNPSTTEPSKPVDQPQRAPIWRAGAFVVVASALATTVWAALADVAGVPMRAGSIGADHSDRISPATFAIATITSVALGVVLAIVLARRAKQPARTFRNVAIGLTALSLVQPLLAGDTTAATKVTLVIAHLIAAGIVIPLLTRRLPAAAYKENRA
jgi:hypothetical protein